MTKTVYGVGVGPGDPGLLTMRAVEVLGLVDVIATPAARWDLGSLALEIARPHLPPACAVEKLELPMTEDRETLARAWDDAALRLADHARAGRSAAFITLGDSTLYSTWSYIAASLARLAADVPLETVPGVTAMAACAVAAGEPLAVGREPLLIWPASPPADADRLLDLAPNVVFMKAGRHLAGLASLVEGGECSATAVRRAGQSAAAITHDLREWVDDRDYFTTVLVRRDEGKGGRT